MAKTLPSISKEYKKEVTNSVFLIVLFFLVYSTLILLSVALIIVLGYFAYQIITFKFTYWTIIIGAGIFSIGIFIFIFLVKFIFSSFKDDNNLMIEINREHEPELFQLIDDVVEDVGTQKPKKVFLSPDVNAFVSYNSAFWSMILPIKKNLTIGLGLINSTNVSELKAILAHEFGHFSQRSMKVGSYVNQANKIIHSTLYDNEGFNDILNKFANTHALIFLFAKFSFMIITGIKWILQKTYEFLYKKHMSLSRQMEFHADAIAATVVGREVNKSALLRLDLSEMALSSSVNFYRNHPENYNTKNIFENQSSLMHFYAGEFRHPIVNGLPKIDLDDLNRYNNTKLIIEDQWASHPTMQQRIEKIQKLNIPSENIDYRLATSILKHLDKYEETLTKKLLSANEIKNGDHFISNVHFLEKIELEETNYKFPEIFNSYYNQKNPPLICLDDLKTAPVDLIKTDFFNDEKVNLVFEKTTVESEIEILEAIKLKQYEIKTLEYNGKRYFANEAGKVKLIAEQRLKILNAEIEENDLNFLHFLASETDSTTRTILNERIKNYLKTEESFEKYSATFQKFLPYVSFMSTILPVEEIRKKRFELIEHEKDFKEMLTEFLYTSEFKTSINAEALTLFQTYIDAKNKYFEFDRYIDSELQMLSDIFDKLTETLSSHFFNTKKDLLDYEADLYKSLLKEENYSTVLAESSNS